MCPTHICTSTTRPLVPVHHPDCAAVRALVCQQMTTARRFVRCTATATLICPNCQYCTTKHILSHAVRWRPMFLAREYRTRSSADQWSPLVRPAFGEDIAHIAPVFIDGNLFILGLFLQGVCARHCMHPFQPLQLLAWPPAPRPQGCAACQPHLVSQCYSPIQARSPPRWYPRAAVAPAVAPAAVVQLLRALCRPQPCAGRRAGTALRRTRGAPDTVVVVGAPDTQPGRSHCSSWA